MEALGRQRAAMIERCDRANQLNVLQRCAPSDQLNPARKIKI
jgi:hypothetical protein